MVFILGKNFHPWSFNRVENKEKSSNKALVQQKRKYNQKSLKIKKACGKCDLGAAKSKKKYKKNKTQKIE